MSPRHVLLGAIVVAVALGAVRADLGAARGSGPPQPSPTRSVLYDSTGNRLGSAEIRRTSSGDPFWVGRLRVPGCGSIERGGRTQRHIFIQWSGRWNPSEPLPLHAYADSYIAPRGANWEIYNRIGRGAPGQTLQAAWDRTLTVRRTARNTWLLQGRHVRGRVVGGFGPIGALLLANGAVANPPGCLDP